MNAVERFKAHFAQHGLAATASAGLATSVLSGLTVKSEASSGRLQITATATTAAVDLEREVVVPGGADTTPIMRMKAVYYNHDYSGLPIATVRKVWMAQDGSGWVIQALTAGNQFAQDVAVTVQDGAINGGSIGFVRTLYGSPTDAELAMYGDHDVITRKWDWWEWSLTPFPCNPDAMIQGVEAKSLPDETIRKIEALASRGKIAVKSARLMGVPERKLYAAPPRLIPRLIGA